MEMLRLGHKRVIVFTVEILKTGEVILEVLNVTPCTSTSSLIWSLSVLRSRSCSEIVDSLLGVLSSASPT